MQKSERSIRPKDLRFECDGKIKNLEKGNSKPKRPQIKRQEQSMVAHGGESPTRKANARRHVAHANVSNNHIKKI
jgi:hypothetical protein